MNKKSKRAVIMAAGKIKMWGRHALEIKGETLLNRIARQLRDRGVTDIWVTAAYPGQHNTEKEFVNPLSGNDLGCLVGCKELEGHIYLFGDVFYSENAMDLIIKGETTYYGRRGGGTLKPYGEFFAFRPTIEMWLVLDDLWQKFKNKKLKRLWSWDLYSYHTNSPKPASKNPIDWTDINDHTDDFDKEEDFKKWLGMYGKEFN
jgi:predicted metal-binding protein